MESVNIVLLGETGVGKSSVINLIAGREVARISTDATACTLSSKQYSYPIGGRMFHIWDTPGLERPEPGAIKKGALKLIQQLAEQGGGIDLLLFCMRGGHVTATTQRNYRFFQEELFRSQISVALVITNLEMESNMEGWWTRNMASLEQRGITPTGHACVTTLPTDKKYSESRANIERMLRGYDGQSMNVMPDHQVLAKFLVSAPKKGPAESLVSAPPKKESKKFRPLAFLTRR